MEKLYGSKEALEEYKEWLAIRDMLFGQNCVKQNIAKAIALAKDCKHPDAQYLANLFADKNVTTVDGAYAVFAQQPETDARALCFGAAFDCHSDYDFKNIQQAAQLGYGFAQSSLVDFLPMLDDSIAFAKKSFKNKERDGFYELARIDQTNKVDVRKCYFIAAQLGHVKSMAKYAQSLNAIDLNCWIWSSRAAKLGKVNTFLFKFCNYIQKHVFNHLAPNIIFFIGKTLQGNIDEHGKRIFGARMTFSSTLYNAKIIFEFYKSQLAAYRSAVDTWTLIARRFGIVKDMRRMIGSMIWSARGEAEYNCLENQGFKESQD